MAAASRQRGYVFEKMKEKVKAKHKVIGIWDYTVVLTYFSAFSAIIGIHFAVTEQLVAAVMCLVISAVCDTFDGKVARTKKNRDEVGKLYGIQIDSMCDLIAFGVFPAIILYFLGEGKTIYIVIGVFYVLCSIIRLSWFNVLELCESGTNDAGEKVFHGLPMPSAAIILPWVMCFYKVLTPKPFAIVLGAVYVFIAAMFIADFEFKKPGTLLQIAGVAFALGGVVLMAVG